MNVHCVPRPRRPFLPLPRWRSVARKLDRSSPSQIDLGELIDELRETKHEALNLRFRNATGQLDNTAEIRRVRRQIARINTFIRMREIEEATK